MWRRWSFVLALVACGDNQQLPRDGARRAVGALSDAERDGVADGALDAPARDAQYFDAPRDAAIDAPTDGPPDAAPDAPPRCGDEHVDPGEQCDVGLAGLSGDGCSSTCATETMVWTDLTPNPIVPRDSPGLAYDSIRHRAVLFGGDATGETWEWDGTWHHVATVAGPSPRVGPAMAFDIAHGVTVMFGGSGLAETWVWDGATWTEQFPAHSPPGRSWGLMAYDAVRNVTVLFGTSTDYRPIRPQLTDTWQWDGTDWTEIFPASSPVPYTTGIASAGPSGVAVFTLDPSMYSTSIWSFDGANWSETPTGNLLVDGPMPFYPGEVFGYDPVRDRYLVLSTNVGTSMGGATAWEWDGSAWTFEFRAGGPPERSTPGIVFDSDRNQLIMVGGNAAVDPSSTRAETWTWDGATWEVFHAGSPTPRDSNVALAYDPLRGVVLAFGGIGEDTTALGDTWTWNQSWAQVVSATAPSARFAPAIAFDEVRRNFVLFGGSSVVPIADIHGFDQLALNDTWIWDGISWAAHVTAHAPDVTGIHVQRPAAAYDRGHGQVILFAAPNTWAWTGSDWAQLHPAHSPDLVSGSAAYDPIRQRIVLRGQIRNIAQAATWEWDGTDWTVRATDTRTYFPPLYYDPLRGQVMMVDATELRAWDGSDWVAADSIPTDQLNAVFVGVAGATLLYGEQDLVTVGPSRSWDTWFGVRTDGNPRELCDGGDADGDGLVGCADPDCWARCRPLCPPNAPCDPTTPHCGDGVCSTLESHGLCPADCP